MFQAWQVHAGKAGIGWLGLLDASDTQIDGSQHRICQRVGVRRLSYIPCADLV